MIFASKPPSFAKLSPFSPSESLPFRSWRGSLSQDAVLRL